MIDWMMKMCVLHGVRGILARGIRGLQDQGFSKAFSTQVTITWRNLHLAQMGVLSKNVCPAEKKTKLYQLMQHQGIIFKMY